MFNNNISFDISLLIFCIHLLRKRVRWFQFLQLLCVWIASMSTVNADHVQMTAMDSSLPVTIMHDEIETFNCENDDVAFTETNVNTVSRIFNTLNSSTANTCNNDTDGDGVCNEEDRDDDNDGILDTVEGARPEYVDWTWNGSSSGTGTFPCDVAPNFTYTVTGYRSVTLDNSEDFDNSGQAFENIYGEANNKENLNIRVNGNTGRGVPIANRAVLNIVFDDPTANIDWAFSLIDLDDDQIQISALDEFNNPVSNSVISSWLRALFDADNSTGGTELPFWDAANSALVGTLDDDCVFNTTSLGSNVSGIEAPGAW
ncbi:MAG: hypothetical protein AB8G22_22690, partial [Saprospiraceae bacterium]